MIYLANLATKVRWTSNAPPLYFDVDYEKRRDGADMQYRITVTFRPSGKDPYGTSYYFGFPIYSRISIDGTSLDTHTIKSASPSTWTSNIVYTTGWLTVAGKASGTASLSLRLYSGDGSDRNATYTYSMDVDPAESTISAPSGTIGQDLKITINRASTSFTHKLTYSIGDTSGTIATGVTAGSYTWAVPVSLVEAIAGSTSGKCKITCVTYSGSTPVGAGKSVTVTLSMPAASTISAPAGTMGTNLAIAIDRANSSFTHKLTYSIGSESGTITTAAGASYTWAVPISLLTEIPSLSSGTCTITCTTYYNGTQIRSATTASVKLAAPAASTVSASAGTIGGSLSISVDRANSSFTHTLKYKIGTKSGTIAISVGTSYSWSVPLSLLTEIPGAASGDCTITCVTYYGSTIVRSQTSAVVKLNAPAASTVTAQNGTMGSSININISRQSTYFTHSISYEIGDLTGLIASNISTSCAWSIPLSLVSAIPNAASGSCTIKCTTYYDGVPVRSATTATITLSAPPASTFTVLRNTVPIGDHLVINISRQVTQYKHDAVLNFVDQEILFEDVDTTVDWVIPSEFAELIPDKTQENCLITLTTKNGTAQIGDPVQATVVFTVPSSSDTKPVIGSVSLTPVNTSLPASFSSVYVQKKSKLKASVVASSSSSSIASLALTVDGATVDAEPQTFPVELTSENVLSTSGTVNVKITAADQRGFYTDENREIDVYAYSECWISAYDGESEVICTRCDASGNIDSSGTYLLIKAKRNYSRIESLNSCVTQYRYKKSTDQIWQNWRELQTVSSGSDLILSVISGVVSDQYSGYNVELKISDTLGSEKTMLFSISTEKITLNLGMGGNKAAFFGYAQREGYLEINGNVWADNLEIAEDISAEGSITAASISSDENITAGGQINAEGNITSDGTVSAQTVSADSVEASTASVDSVEASTASVTGNTTVGGNLTVTGDVTADEVSASSVSVSSLSASGTVSAASVSASESVSADSISATSATLGSVGTNSLSVNEKPTFTAPTPYGGRCNVDSGGYTTLGKLVFVQMTATMLTSLNIGTTLSGLMTGFPAPADIVALAITRTNNAGTNRPTMNCYVNASGGLYLVGTTTIDADTKISITGSYWIN